MGHLGRCAAVYGAIALGIGACAAGADAEGDNFGPPPSTISAAPADGTDGSSSTGGGKEETGGESEPANDGSSDEGPADDTGAMSTDEGGSTNEGGSTGDDGPAMACENDLTCASADAIGGVAGDESTPQIVVSGDTPTWVTFQVSENNSDFTGETLSFRVTLQSPPTADFDLYVFRGPEGGSSGCGGTTMQSTSAGGVDMVQMQWGEGGAFANNVDDGAWVAVEVRAKNGTCDPPAQWTLTVVGDV